MRNILVVLCMMLASVALAEESATPMAAVHQFIDSFNKGDVAGAEAAHAADVTITDEFPPFHWQGAGAFKSWLADLTKNDTANGVSDGHMKLVGPVREEASGDRAYVVMATEFTFKKKGVPMREPSQMTFALKKEAAGWRIAGWTFAGPKPTP